MAWEYLGKKFDLDYVILGPEGFFAERDSSFNHTFNNDYLNGISDYIHSRYILKENETILVDPVGRSKREILANYWKFLPSFRYLRYDYECPVFMRPWAAFFTPDKKFKRNPFYYRPNLNSEMTTIYKLLLSKIANSESHILLGNYREDIVKLGEELNNSNLTAVSLYRPMHFPYMAIAHNSPLGNQLVARQFFNLLNQKPQNSFTLLYTRGTAPELTRAVKLENLDLYKYREISVEMNGLNLGYLYDQRILQGDRFYEPNIARSSESVSFLVLKKPGQVSWMAPLSR